MGGSVYCNDDQHWEVVSEVMKQTIITNPLHTEYKMIGQQEVEIVRHTIDLYNGTKEQCGITTSGGTESILTSILAHREWGRKDKGIVKPNMVMSETAHAAFNKGAFYFGVETRMVK